MNPIPDRESGMEISEDEGFFNEIFLHDNLMENVFEWKLAFPIYFNI